MLCSEPTAVEQAGRQQVPDLVRSDRADPRHCEPAPDVVPGTTARCHARHDRATIGSTIIRAGAKLDNLIQVAHNVEIGNSTVIAAQAGISGSTKIGKGAMIGGQAGVVGHLQIGDGAKINAQSGVSKSIEAGKAVTGSPAQDYTAALRSQAIGRNLPELEKRVKELEALIKEILKEKA